ncbi:MAG: ATP-binding cassette domain-containing protein [Gammaproteobacteria bacterium]|nr:ATP-binding cassette domain-containing protein [Gammaproteobacteria bacterium]
MSEKIIFDSVSFYYEKDYPILNNFSYVFDSEDCVAITGPSGSGKTSLLHLLSGWIYPVSGQIIYSRPAQSGENFRYVFSAPYLIAELNALDNIFLDRPMSPVNLEKCHSLAEAFQVKHLLSYWPSQLSSGQQQRVSIIRALMSDAPFFLADEPTAHLDPHRAYSLMQEVMVVLRKQKQGLICVTHDPQLHTLFDRQLDMSQLEDNIH